MTLPESNAPDAAFPGAHSQVPHAPAGPALAAGARRAADPSAERGLPLEAAPSPAGGGWLIRLPVRAEQVTVTKQVVVRERVSVQRQVVSDVAHVEAEVARERLRLDTQGQVRVTGADDEAAEMPSADEPESGTIPTHRHRI